MFFALLSIWFIQHLVSIDLDKYNNTFLETREFTVEIWNLPPLTEEYSAEVLKADLHDVLSRNILDADQVLPRLESTGAKQNCEIVEIVLAYSNYIALSHVVEI